jgi:hypothetical protein
MPDNAKAKRADLKQKEQGWAAEGGESYKTQPCVEFHYMIPKCLPNYIYLFCQKMFIFDKIILTNSLTIPPKTLILKPPS